MPASGFGDRVFLNVPFDRSYKALFEALVFAVHDCGYFARCALEGDDGSVVRLNKIFDIIAECQYGIHDLSRTTLDTANRLPRFNMPLQSKTCLILDRDPYRYQVFCSDIAGQDIRAHGNEGALAIGLVRDWLRASRKNASANIPGGARITQRYRQFRSDLPEMCDSGGLEAGPLIFLDYRTLVVGWLQGNPW